MDIAELKGLSDLRWDDQMKIRKLGGFETEGDDVEEELDVDDEVEVEYAKSGRGKCRECGTNIQNKTMRLSFLDTKQFYHPDCFKLPISVTKGKDIEGYTKLTPEDKETLDELVKKSVAKSPKPKKRESEDSEASKKKKIADQLWKIKDKVDKKYDTNELKAILKHNKQRYNAGRSALIDRIADGELFGALTKCKICEHQLVKEEGVIRCKGHISEFTRCSFETTEIEVIERVKWEYPDENMIAELIEEIKISSTSQRNAYFLPISNTTFKDISFHICGSVKDKDLIVDQIVAGGGKVIEDGFDAVLTSFADVKKQKQTAKIKSAIQKNTPIYDFSVVDTCVFFDKPFDSIKALYLIYNKNKAQPLDMAAIDSVIKPITKKLLAPPLDKDTVYPNGTIYHADDIPHAVTLNVTDLTVGQTGRNSFYTMQCIQAAGRVTLFTRWGRIGQDGEYKEDEYYTADDMLYDFKKKFFEMTKNRWESFIYGDFQKQPGKYFPVDIDTEEEEDQVVNISKFKGGSSLDTRIQDLIKLMFNQEMISSQMSEMNIDTEKLPLGKLSKKRLADGTTALQKIEEMLENQMGNDQDEKTLQMRFEDLSNQFYTAIPHDFGHNKPPTIDAKKLLYEKYELLNILTDIEVAARMLENTNIKKDPLQDKYDQLLNKIEPLDKNSDEWERISTYVNKTRGSYKLNILDIFKVDRKGEKESFAMFEHIDNRKLLWHGSSVAVFPAILSTGLKIMPHSGGRVGKGLYFADMLEKSAGYCGLHENVGLLLLNEVVLGDIHTITKDDSSLRKAPGKSNSVLAQGRIQPDSKMDYEDLDLSPSGHPVIIPQGDSKNTNVKSSFHHNEYLVYDAKQAHMRYLLKLEWPKKQSWY